MAVASSDPAHSPTAVHEWPVEGMGGGERGGEGDITLRRRFLLCIWTHIRKKTVSELRERGREGEESLRQFHLKG